MTSPRDSNDDGAPQFASDPTGWPPRDYRDWVHSQVANRILLRIGAIGIGSIIVLAGGYITVHDRLLESSQNAVRDLVVEQVRPTIRNEVLFQIMDKSELVEDAKGQIDSAVNDSIGRIFSSEQFTKTASRHLHTMLDRTGGPQDIILNKALARAADPVSPIPCVRLHYSYTHYCTLAYEHRRPQSLCASSLCERSSWRFSKMNLEEKQFLSSSFR